MYISRSGFARAEHCLFKNSFLLPASFPLNPFDFIKDPPFIELMFEISLGMTFRANESEALPIALQLPPRLASVLQDVKSVLHSSSR